MIPLSVPLSVLVTTRNEEANIERCLQSVHGFADQIFVLDSESTDRTVEIARRTPRSTPWPTTTAGSSPGSSSGGSTTSRCATTGC